MFYIFAYLSVFSPAILLQSRVLDTPLAPTIGALPICLANVCVVFPRPGTTLRDFVRDIPRPTFPAIDAAPPARVIIPDGTEGDGGGGGRLDWSKKSPHTLPLLAQKLRQSNVEPFTWDAFQESDIRFITSAFPHRNFPRAVYPSKTAVKLNPDIPPTSHSDRVISPNPHPPPDLWSYRDKYLALSNSGGLGRNGSMDGVNWSFGHNRSALSHDVTTPNGNHRARTTPSDVELPSLSLVNRTDGSDTVSKSNTAGQFNLAIGLIAIGLNVELKYPKPILSPPQRLLSSRETSLAISNFGGLGCGRSVSGWDLGLIRLVFKLAFRRRRSNVVNHAKRRPRPFAFTRHLFKISLLFRTSHFPAQPQYPALEKASYFLDETCPIDGSADDSLQGPPSPAAAAVDWPFVGLPQCLLSDQAHHLHNDTCLNPQPLLSLTKPAVGSRAVLQPQCPLADKALHLLNDTCVPAPEDESSTPVLKVELPSLNAIPFRPISVHSLPCLAADKDQKCGFYAPPSLDMALDWDIRSQAALIARETPAFLTIVPDFKLPACRKRRSFSLGANVCSPPPASLPHNTLPANPRSFPIRIRYIIAIALAVLGKAISLAKRDRQSEGWFALVVTLAALGQAFYLAKFKRPKSPDAEAPPAVPKVEEAPVKAGVAVTLAALGQAFSTKFRGFKRLNIEAPLAVPKLEEVKTAVTVILATLGQVFSLAKFRRSEKPDTEAPPAVLKLEEVSVVEMVDINVLPKSVPAPAAPKSTPSPTKGKARMVAGKRVQPARKSKTPSPSTSASGLEASASTGSVVGKGRSPKRSKRA